MPRYIEEGAVYGLFDQSGRASLYVGDIDVIPRVDVVEVVRCKKCQYWNPRYETMGMCMKHNSIVTFTKPDFFCAWGKDKNDGICKED